jgi:dCTP deaminase
MSKEQFEDFWKEMKSKAKESWYDFLDLFHPVLSDKSIKKYNDKGLLIEQPIKESQMQPNSVDLTLGNTWKVLKPNTQLFRCNSIDPRIPIAFEEGVFEVGRINDTIKNPHRTQGDQIEYEEMERYIVQPHTFVLMASNEILNIPNGIIGFVCGRSSVARLAIQTEQAGLIDSGFRGTITFEVFNQSHYPIILYPGMRIAQVYFFKTQRSLAKYGSTGQSKYINQIAAMQSKIHLDPELKR